MAREFIGGVAISKINTISGRFAPGSDFGFLAQRNHFQLRKFAAD